MNKVNFQHVPVGTLNVSTNTYTGAPQNNGMHSGQFAGQVQELINKKVPLAKALQAIKKHPDIVDKEKAAQEVKTLYQQAKEQEKEAGQKK